MTTLPDVAQLTAFLNELADHASEVAMRYFRSSVTVEHKADASPVTIADRETEQALRVLIQQHFPEHDIYGEEFGHGQLDQRYCWVLDPIDGTKSFISGMPTFGSLIALLDSGVPIYGVIDIPALKERWIGGHELASQQDGKLCRSSNCQQLSQAKLFSTTIDMFEGEDLQRYQKLSQQVAMRRFGGDCYAYGLLASGYIDLVVETSMAAYDYCALAPVIEHAGGMISDWQGKPLTLHSDGSVVAAATESLQQAVLEILNSN